MSARRSQPLNSEQTLDKFSEGGGNNWPFYVPAYFDDVVRPRFLICRQGLFSCAFHLPEHRCLQPAEEDSGAFNVLTASYLGARVDDAGESFPAGAAGAEFKSCQLQDQIHDECVHPPNTAALCRPAEFGKGREIVH